MFSENLGNQLLAFLSMLVCGIFVIESGEAIYDHIRRDYATREDRELIRSNSNSDKQKGH
jgi:hypothetical protein